MHDDANALPKGLVPEDAQRHAIDQNLARTRLQQPEYHLEQRSLPTAGRPGDRHIITGPDTEIDIAEHEGFALGIAEAKVTDLEIALYRLLIRDRAEMSLLRLGAGDIRQPFEMEVEHTEFDRPFDQLRRLIDKLLLIRNEGEQHADRHVAGECCLCAEIY